MIDSFIRLMGGEAKTVAFAILSGIIGFLAKSFYDLRMIRRKDKLERVNNQLKELYGPLYALVQASGITWQAFVENYCRRPDFQVPGGIRPQSKETEAIWRHWMKNVFMPMNAEMARLILQHADLLEEVKMPYCLLLLSAHVHGYQGILAAWDSHDYSRHMSLTSFPSQELSQYTEKSYGQLKARQEKLIGRTRTKNFFKANSPHRD
jgi:hypothetical protein